jgi:hypothetical protein
MASLPFCRAIIELKPFRTLAATILLLWTADFYSLRTLVRDAG